MRLLPVPRRPLAGLLVVVAVVVAGCGDDDDSSGAPSTTAATAPSTAAPSTTATTTAPTTTAGPSTTAVPSTTATTAAPTTTTGGATTSSTLGSDLAPGDAAFVVWPFPGSDLRYDDPVAAATGFATELVGFSDPVVGEFMAGDSRSGEIEVRPRPDGPVTLVLVRQYGAGDHWWVMAGITGDIELTEPAPQSAIDDPVLLRGRSRAFEGTVQVSVIADGSTEPVGEGFVTGGAGPDLGPFEGEVAFTSPHGGWGSLVLYTDSAEDGTVQQATVIRVGFIGGD